MVKTGRKNEGREGVFSMLAPSLQSVVCRRPVLCYIPWGAGGGGVNPLHSKIPTFNQFSTP